MIRWGKISSKSQQLWLVGVLGLLALSLLRQWWWIPLDAELTQLEKQIEETKLNLRQQQVQTTKAFLPLAEEAPLRATEALQRLQTLTQQFALELVQQSLTPQNMLEGGESFEIQWVLKGHFEPLQQWQLALVEGYPEWLWVDWELKNLELANLDPRLQIRLRLQLFLPPPDLR